MATAFRLVRPNANAHWSCNDRRWLPSHLAKAGSLRGALRLRHRRSFCLAGHSSLCDLLAAPDDVVELSRGYGQNVATVQCPVGDLPRLEERVRRTAQAVLPSVVAVRNPSDKSSKVGGYQNNYSSGVIITADGIVLSQGHVSHWKVQGRIGAVRRLAPRATGRRSFSTTAVSVLPNCWARIAFMMSLSCGCSSLVRIRTCPSAPRLPSKWATGFSSSVTRSDTGRADPLPCGLAV